MKYALSMVLICGLPLGVAACPTAEDLPDGIVITAVNGAGTQTHGVRRISGDLVWHSQSSQIFPDAWRVYSHGGAFRLFAHKESGTYQTIVRYDPPPPPMETLMPGTVYTAYVSWGDPEGEKQWRGELTYSVAENEPVDIDGCRYETLRITSEGDLTYPDGKTKRYSHTEVFVPELAFTLGYVIPSIVTKGGWFSDIPSDGSISKQARSLPVLGEVLQAYGIAQ